MSEEAFSSLLFEQPAYALIIGISEYGYSQPANDKNVLAPKNFRALNFAAKDAEDFATFLRGNGFVPDNVYLLRNDEATAKNIKIQFNSLISACDSPDVKNPLVIVYFSGHGFATDRDNHYLVPYDGERDQLFATGISNEEFNSLLKRVHTPRLVVFLDCCHAGGMVGLESEDARGRAAVKYDFARGLGGGSGRIVIASCRPGEESYESDGNGIFTGKLLGLLSGQSPFFADCEEIDSLRLYSQLRDEVLQAAKEKHNTRQEPQINEASSTTGIVLAINQKAKQRRLTLEAESRERREDFLNLVVVKLRSMASLGRPAGIIRWMLERYAREQISDEGYEPLYAAFEEYLLIWGPGFDSIVVQCCNMLFDMHKQALETLRSKSNVASSARPMDTLETAPRPSLVSPPSPTQLPLSEQQITRRTVESELRTARLEK